MLVSHHDDQARGDFWAQKPLASAPEGARGSQSPPRGKRKRYNLEEKGGKLRETLWKYCVSVSLRGECQWCEMLAGIAFGPFGFHKLRQELAC